MTVIVEFTNPMLQDFVMEGPSVDYQIHQGFLKVIFVSTKFAVLFWMLVLIFGLAACAYSEMDTTYDTEAEELPPSMFVEIERGNTYRIVYQKETKVMYAISDQSYSEGFFTLLIDENGDPMLYEGE